MQPSESTKEGRPPSSLVLLLRRLLAEPRLRDVDVDSRRLIDLHRQILFEKPLMRGVMQEFYDSMVRADERYFTAPGRRVELGSGSSVFEQLHPDVLPTDIKVASNVAAVVDAQSLPFRRGSIRAFFGINCFHHFPDPERFFREVVDVLPPGAGCILIEPYHGPLAGMLYKRLFATETFDKTQRDWIADSTGPMTGANQVLSWIVFVRDRDRFESLFPELEIVTSKPLTNYPRYLLSGGLNFRSLIPSWMGGVVRFFEWCLTPLSPWLALHYLIVLRRR